MIDGRFIAFDWLDDVRGMPTGKYSRGGECKEGDEEETNEMETARTLEHRGVEHMDIVVGFESFEFVVVGSDSYVEGILWLVWLTATAAIACHPCQQAIGGQHCIVARRTMYWRTKKHLLGLVSEK